MLHVNPPCPSLSMSEKLMNPLRGLRRNWILEYNRMPYRCGVCLLTRHPIFTAPCLPYGIWRHHSRSLQGVDDSIRRNSWFPVGRESHHQNQGRRRVSLCAIGGYGQFQPGPSGAPLRSHGVVLSSFSFFPIDYYHTQHDIPSTFFTHSFYLFFLALFTISPNQTPRSLIMALFS